MAKPKHIELNEGSIHIPILYEDRSVLALDKPAGWMLAPDSWDETGRNLQLPLLSSMNAGDFWASSRNLKYLRYIHRLDADTTGITMFAKSPGALKAYSELFEERSVEKFYLAVVQGIPKETRWTCNLPLQPDPAMKGRMIIARATSAGPRLPMNEPKDAETHFEVLQTLANTALVEAHPTTGRTHQIRVHLAAGGHPVVADDLYGTNTGNKSRKLALRAVELRFRDPFQKRNIRIQAPVAAFLREHGFEQIAPPPSPTSPPIAKKE